jgi:hypothetical protein
LKFLSGNRKTYGKAEKPTGICKTRREFAFPYRNPLFPAGIRKTLRVIQRKRMRGSSNVQITQFEKLNDGKKELNGPSNAHHPN